MFLYIHILAFHRIHSIGLDSSEFGATLKPMLPFFPWQSSLSGIALEKGPATKQAQPRAESPATLMFVQSHLPHRCRENYSKPWQGLEINTKYCTVSLTRPHEPVVLLGVAAALPVVSQHAEEETKHRLLSSLRAWVVHQKSHYYGLNDLSFRL